MPRTSHMNGEASCAADHVPHPLSNYFFIAQSILHGTHSSRRTENVRSLFGCGPSVDALRREDAEIAGRNLGRLRSRIQSGGKFCRAADLQSTFTDGAHMFLKYVVSMDLYIRQARQMRSDHAA